jgi:hypothetical protein
LDGLHGAGHIDELRPIAVGVVNELGDDVVVRNQMPGPGHEEARADRGLGSGAGLDDLDFDDAVSVAAEHLGRRDSSRLCDEVAGPEEQRGEREWTGERHRGSGLEIRGSPKWE